MKESPELQTFGKGLENKVDAASLIAEAEKLSQPAHFEVPAPDPEQVAQVQREQAQVQLEKDFAINKVRKDLETTSAPVEQKSFQRYIEATPEISTTTTEITKGKKRGFWSRLFS